MRLVRLLNRHWLWGYYATASIYFGVPHRAAIVRRCSKCGRRKWVEELVGNYGWCDACFDASWASYVSGSAETQQP